MTRILLVRHGESEWNVHGRWQGHADPPLTDLGRRQARAAAAAIGSVDAVASSDLQRAATTAEIIAEQLGVGPVLVEPGFRERDAGEWSGLTRHQIHDRYPGYLRDDPAFDPEVGERRPPGYEPEDVLVVRALGALHRLAAEVGDADVVVVTHGGVIHGLERHLGETTWTRLANLAARWVDVEGDSVRLGERLVLVAPDQLTESAPDQL